MIKKISVFFAWYDFWIGWFYDRVHYTLYICLIPTIVIKITFKYKVKYKIPNYATDPEDYF